MVIPVGKLHAPVLAGVMNCYLTRGIAGGRTILNDVARQASLGLRAHQRNRTVQNGTPLGVWVAVQGRAGVDFGFFTLSPEFVERRM